ncbi:MAG: hypothetical protein FVQ81_15255 [Candidatus Glassbacteria bacterium]|nr:hypothetical protein [Candidatus Glassbacteria bacterium]
MILASLPSVLRPQNAVQPPDSAGSNSRQELLDRLPEGFMDSTSSISPAADQRERKSPGGAFLRSLAVPGWGQFYTEHPVRGTITAAAETAFLLGMVLEFRDRAEMRDELSRLEEFNGPDWPVDDPERVALNSRIKSAQRKAGDYMAYGATALLLGILDSYISAHLYNFDRHFVFGPGGQTRLACTVRF